VLSSVGDLALREAGEPWACGAHDAVLRYTDPAGVYFARLETGEGTASWRICLTR
jgi:hypothetical protein